ncbi:MULTISPECIES: LytR/AlgR family response regulator transcription factor [Rhodanobacter]|uniref:LytR/AlgR family response regulator transcription factor n=1 Tax=Rhodanobacter TaxID=75309 RepID=UPI00040E0BA7|nr:MULTISPECIES: LytTR family DNA-binding domain-containing protein [Rhodanobacter]KZC19956.1 DNA-binding response regulator [Rhodanobacter denitrificans]UJJ51215.1 LytTR family DNA-binding domain-containing protein [Rhodanobacter denitrificans]UJM93963.1 LytTR family DNA-binding domain-containing protein [Rhodanobacter denitrificans]UJM97492.1 LytTR family DNA-binding domain-containing protein [Rhodanobacter denitrificans]UJN23093.1 LytTR family DNA-binding domain-containing protein [Rhodanob
MRVLVVDDEPLARARLAALLGDCAGVEVVGNVGDGEAALAALGELQPDALLLDINMPGIDGVALAQRLAGRTRPQVIFCTAYEAHALKAFELGAADYLLKPVRLDRLREALQRAQRRLADAPREPAAYLYGRLRGEQVRIALDEVICLLAEEKYVVVQHRRGELLIEDSLRQLEEAYPDQLIRLHRNCLVPPPRLLGLKTLADGRVLARLDGSELNPEISRRNLPAVRKLLRLG